MNKNRMILAGLGGAIGLAVLVMAYLTWTAFSAKTAALEGDDETEGLETAVSKAQGLSRKPVYPSAESVNAINSNATLMTEWHSEALKLAARGDKVFPKTTPAAFKTFIVDDAKRLAALPGCANGRLAKPDFTFGPFKDFIAEGKMPEEAQLDELQRKWDDVTIVIETLAGCGIAEIVNLEVKTATEEAPKADNRSRANKRRAAAKDESAAKATASYTYVFTFSSRPANLVKVINALETCERFVVVDNFSFVRPKDVIADTLGSDEKQEAAQRANSGRRGRRGRRAAEAKDAEPETAAPKNGIVTDPALDAPMTVTMTVSVHDFRSLEDTEKKTEEEAK